MKEYKYLQNFQKWWWTRLICLTTKNSGPDTLQNVPWDNCATTTASLCHHSIGPWTVALELVPILCLETTVTCCHLSSSWILSSPSCIMPPASISELRSHVHAQDAEEGEKVRIWHFSDSVGGVPHPGLGIRLLCASPWFWDPSLSLTYSLWLWPYCNNNSKCSITVDNVPDAGPDIWYAITYSLYTHFTEDKTEVQRS